MPDLATTSDIWNQVQAGTPPPVAVDGPVDDFSQKIKIGELASQGKLPELPKPKVPTATEDAMNIASDIGKDISHGAAKGISNVMSLGPSAINLIPKLAYMGYRHVSDNPMTEEEKKKLADLEIISPNITSAMVDLTKGVHQSMYGDMPPEKTTALDELKKQNFYDTFAPKTKGGESLSNIASLFFGGKALTGNKVNTANMLTSAVGAEGGRKTLEGTPYEPLGEITGSLAGYPAPNVGASALRKVLGVDAEKLATFEQAGMTPVLGDVGNKHAGQAQDIVSNIPLSAGVIEKGQNIALEQADKILKQYGLSQAKSAQGAGQVVKEGLTDWMGRGKKTIGKLYNKFDTFIPEDSKISTDKLSTTLSAIRNENKITPNLEKNFENSEAGRILGNIEDDISGAAKGTQTKNVGIGLTDEFGVPLTKKVVTQPKFDMTYKSIKKYRTLIGSKLSDFQNLKTEDEATLSRLYGALTDTMRAAAAQKGPQALAAFERANSVNAAFMDKAKSIIDPILKKPDVQEMFNKVLLQQKIGGKAQSVMDSLSSDEKQIVRGSLFKQMGENNVNKFNPYLLATKFNGLETEAQSALLSGLKTSDKAQFGKAMKALEIMEKSRGASESNKTMVKFIETAKDVAGGGATAVGLAARPLSTVTTLGVSNISARLMTNPKFIRWLANAPNKNGAISKSAINQLKIIANESPDIADDINSILNSDSQ